MFGASPFVSAGAAALVAAIFGIQLGNSTVAAIKPTFFLGPAVHPRDRGVAIDPRDLEARRLARLETAYGALYGWDEGNRSLRLACIDCGGSGSRPHATVFDYDARVPYFGSREERAADEARERLAADRIDRSQLDDPVDHDPDADAGEISRYAEFPVTEDDIQAGEPESPRASQFSDIAKPRA